MQLVDIFEWFITSILEISVCFRELIIILLVC